MNRTFNTLGMLAFALIAFTFFVIFSDEEPADRGASPSSPGSGTMGEQVPAPSRGSNVASAPDPRHVASAPDPRYEASADGLIHPDKCKSPIMGTEVYDLQEIPSMRSVFDSGEEIVRNAPLSTDPRISGELFRIGDSPAYALYFPGAKAGHAAAIFDNRFLAFVKGECIPSLNYLKAALRK